MATLFEILAQQAEKQGFPLSGAVDIETVLGSTLDSHVERYDRWLSQGREGEMAYLRRGRDRRADPRLVFPEAKSVFCVAIPYWRQPIGDAQSGPRYARYLKGPDYHDRIAEMLESVMSEAKRQAGAEFADLSWKVCVDTSAVLERSWAALAGLGWIGKNTTLINPKYGSYLFLGEVLISREFGMSPKPLPNYCGNCSRCLEACPTSAFVTAGQLDSRRCISYWTLEKRGELDLSESDKRKIGTWVAGCDICQEVCPFNLKPAREALTPPEGEDATTLSEWLALLSESTDAYRARVKESALNRVKPAQFSRNLAIALRNFILDSQPSEAERASLRAAVTTRSREETDPVATAEWGQTLHALL
jgi:epoxyqueuosine reductase